MENNLKDNKSKDREQKQIADDLAPLLDSIDKETTDLTEVVLEEESLLDDTALDGEDDLAWLDTGVFESEDLELDLEAPDDSAKKLLKHAVQAMVDNITVTGTYVVDGATLQLAQGKLIITP